MDYDSEIERILAELPKWMPPAGFAERLSRNAAARPIEAAPTRWFWIWTTVQAASVAVIAYAASVFVSRAATSLSVDGTQVLERYARSLFSL
jgi:hypothetical protein